MPIISQFYGILIRMYFDDNEQHNLPHLHAEYTNYKATFNFSSSLIAGNLPIKQKKLVEAWILIHTEELITL